MAGRMASKYQPLKRAPNINVEKALPINPSHVFFGERAINGVLPIEKGVCVRACSCACVRLYGCLCMGERELGASESKYKKS